MLSVVSALISALLQITLGFYKTPSAAWICFTVAAISWVIVIFALFIVSSNLEKMINFAELKAEENNIPKSTDAK